MQAIEEAERNDRMHLKTTYFNYARHAEAEEEIQAAINAYTKSGTHHTQVPRMLFDDPLELENYVMKSQDRWVLLGCGVCIYAPTAKRTP